MIALLLAPWASAAGVHPVGAGETVESIASDLGRPELATQIRGLNGLGPDQQPRVGQLLDLPEPPGAHADQQGWFIAVVGEVTVQPFGVAPTPAGLYERLPPGALLCTGLASYAALRVATQCAAVPLADDLTLGPETCVVIETAFSALGTRSSVVRVLRGSVAVPSTEAGGSVTVLSEGAVTTGRTGGYRVTVEKERSRTEALYAAVAVRSQGEEVRLAAGQGVQVRHGQPPDDPVDLLPPGMPLRPEPDAVLYDPSFGWSPADGALGYRIEIAADPAFREVLYAEDVPKPFHGPDALLLRWPTTSTLFWRVSSFDRMGFLGVPSDPRGLRLPTSGGAPR